VRVNHAIRQAGNPTSFLSQTPVACQRRDCATESQSTSMGGEISTCIRLMSLKSDGRDDAYLVPASIVGAISCATSLFSVRCTAAVVAIHRIAAYVWL
jgi:hypothetical protein